MGVETRASPALVGGRFRLLTAEIDHFSTPRLIDDYVVEVVRPDDGNLTAIDFCLRECATLIQMVNHALLVGFVSLEARLGAGIALANPDARFACPPNSGGWIERFNVADGYRGARR